MASWQFILSDLQGVPYGELTNADNRKVVDPWERIPTASASIPLWHPLADTVMTQPCLLKCYRYESRTGSKTLVFHGQVLTAEENADGNAQSIGISAVGPFHRLGSRLLGKTGAGIAFGTAAVPIDLSVIGRNIVDTVNGDGYTGITTSTTGGSGAVTTNCGQTASTGTWWLKPASEAIAEIASGMNSFEWRVRPTEPITGLAFPRLGLIDFGPESSFNTTRPDAIYEYGTPRANVASYTRQMSREAFINTAYVSVQGWPDAPPVYGGVKQGLTGSADAASITANGLYEQVVPDNGVIPQALRVAIANWHLRFRKIPKSTITFTPAPDATPTPYVDYQVGQTIRARAVVRGVQRFDANFRVWGITFNIDKGGVETVEIELVEP